ncbi:HAD family hydrolase [Rubellicoccus peritrichatus]|uniref:phosphoglycolate phosphatase n=1 Tax=Rubellicoccus peritrichatus TaxID=3080537 RepID=A0AAQ3QUX8_9BACT|nr:HAD family hydrolase [Puniceicoccus sp. CR14]WOO42886.1 HAD family hydrolase [Puniceicoccus sp. CR14]
MPDAKNIRTVLFDLDGTLIDHFTAIYRCYKFAQETLGLPTATYETVRATVGGSVPVTMTRLVGQDKAEEATRLFRMHFEEIMLEDLHLLPSAEWLLQELHQQGMQLAVFTNKSGEPSRKIMTHLGLDRYLVDTIGSLDTEWKKPEPEFTRYALEKIGATPEATVLIGDSPFDIEAARAGGLPSYVVATGSHTLEQLQANDPAPDGVFPTLLELGEAIFGLSLEKS